MPDTTLTLGDFQFAGLEIPDSLPFGGAQRLAIHRLVGGAKVVDSMGRDDLPITWSGIFLGQDAADRARYLDTLRVAGTVLDLAWSTRKYSVVIREFHADFKRFYEIPYSITCEVVQDETAPLTAAGAPPVDKALADDSTTASTLSDSIGDSTLSGIMATVNSSIAAVSSFATAAQSQINSVLQPIATARQQVGILITSASNTVANVTTFGGILPGNPVAVAAAKLSGQVAAVGQLGNLYSLNSVLGRMQSNLGAINSSQRTVATAGGNLFQVAEKQYGDAGAWTGIAKANGLTDPFINGSAVLTIPPLPGDTSGVLNA